MDHPIFTSTESARRVAKSLPPNERASFKHSNKVKRKALAVGRVLELRCKELDLLQVAAQWHDLGKFDPDLRKLFFEHRGKFTPEQAEKGRIHAYLSAVFFQKYWQRFVDEEKKKMVRPIAIMIAGHHWLYCESEKRYYQLTSNPEFAYPTEQDHELGDFPLLGLRILKVVDHYQGETEQRHYKAGRHPIDTLQEMVLKANEDFDPIVLRALEKVLYTKLGRS